ncbi:hypothetical protein [Kitasatospora sp. NPDC057541]|uniref:TRADD-N-associated membrane domain-containing protein n=1 Tax=unclassified Kitasatospora TaxID=2633591 RepID=UPI0036A592B3
MAEPEGTGPAGGDGGRPTGSSRVLRYLESSTNLAGSLGGMVGLGLHFAGVVSGALFPLVVLAGYAWLALTWRSFLSLRDRTSDALENEVNAALGLPPVGDAGRAPRDAGPVAEYRRTGLGPASGPVVDSTVLPDNVVITRDPEPRQNPSTQPVGPTKDAERSEPPVSPPVRRDPIAELEQLRSDNSAVLITKYYTQGYLQSQRAFALSMSSAVVGFGLMAVGVVLFYRDPDHLAPGTVSAVAGVVSNTVSVLFFRQADRARDMMISMIDKLRLDREQDARMRSGLASVELIESADLKDTLRSWVALGLLAPPSSAGQVPGLPVPGASGIPPLPLPGTPGTPTTVPPPRRRTGARRERPADPTPS